MKITYNAKQITSAIELIKDLMRKKRGEYKSIVTDAKMLYHQDFPEHIFIRYKQQDYNDAKGDFNFVTHYKLIDKNGDQKPLDELIPDVSMRYAVIRDAYEIKSQGGRIELSEW